MENTGKWEFDCPQFVDFAAGLDNSPNNVSWLGNSAQKPKKDGIFSHDRKSLGPKMATPKVKPMQSLKNSLFINKLRPIQTDDEKLSTLHNLHRYSKSEDFLHQIGENKRLLRQPPRKTFNHGLRRSFSENCIKIKKKAYPSTPMCLKRTLNKPKAKGKTTEELELEKINELQNKLSRQLKLNQVNRERMRNNKAPYLMYDFYKTKGKLVEPRTAKEDTKVSKFSQQMNDLKKDLRKSKFQMENFNGMSDNEREKNHVLTVRSKAEKLQKVLNSIRPAPVVPSNALRLLNGDNKAEKTFLHNQIPLVKYNAHSGVKFLRYKDTTVPHPFSFDASYASLPNSSFQMKENKVQFSSSVWISNVAKDKENFHPSRLPVKKGGK